MLYAYIPSTDITKVIVYKASLIFPVGKSPDRIWFIRNERVILVIETENWAIFNLTF